MTILKIVLVSLIFLPWYSEGCEWEIISEYATFTLLTRVYLTRSSLSCIWLAMKAEKKTNLITFPIITSRALYPWKIESICFFFLCGTMFVVPRANNVIETKSQPRRVLFVRDDGNSNVEYVPWRTCSREKRVTWATFKLFMFFSEVVSLVRLRIRTSGEVFINFKLWLMIIFKSYFSYLNVLIN